MTSFETSAMELVMQRTSTKSEAAEKMPIRMELEAVESKLRELLMKMVFEDENASVILYGYPGQGKSLVVDRVFSRLERELHSKGGTVMCGVYLNGMIDGDKREGLKSIARQLCSFLDVQFLSHASAEQNIQFLRRALEKLHGAEMSCVFVLDAFERFVKDSEKQEIVYTLLDLLQSRDVRACVIGMTTDFRVKSHIISHDHTFNAQQCDDIFSVIQTMMEMPKKKKDKKIENYNCSIEAAVMDPMIQAYATMCQGCFSPRDASHVAVLAVTNATTRSSMPFVITPEDVRYAFEQCIKQHDPLVIPLRVHQKSSVLVASKDFRTACTPSVHAGILFSAGIQIHLQSHDTAFAKYEGFIRRQGTSDVFEEPLMTHAFNDLHHANLIVRSKDTKRGWSTASTLESYSLNVTKAEIHRGICVNPFASTVLHAAFKSD